MLDSSREKTDVTELAKLKTFYVLLRNLGPTNNAAINKLRDVTRNALLVGGKEIAEIVYSTSTNELQTETVNYNGVDYEVYKYAHIVAMPAVHTSPSVILRTFK